MYIINSWFTNGSFFSFYFFYRLTYSKINIKKNPNSHKSEDLLRRFRGDHLSSTLATEQLSSRNRDIDSSRPCRDVRRNGHTYGDIKYYSITERTQFIILYNTRSCRQWKRNNDILYSFGCEQFVSDVLYTNNDNNMYDDVICVCSFTSTIRIIYNMATEMPELTSNDNIILKIVITYYYRYWRFKILIFYNYYYVIISHLELCTLHTE